MPPPDSDRECHCRLHEPTESSDAELDDSDRKLLGDIRQYGWHVVLIPDDAVSRGWAFSVGMWHTLGSPDVALFGLELPEAHAVLNSIGGEVRHTGRIRPDTEFTNIFEERRAVTFRPIHPSWYRPMFGYATWFAQRPTVPLVQAVWSDPDGRWPWTDGIDVDYRVAQPNLWIPAGEHPQGSWSGTLAPHPWPFGDEPNTAVFTTRRIAFDGADVLGVSHDDDGSWQFLDGGSTTQEDAALVHMAHVVGAHTDVAELADLPTGWQAWRASVDSPWRRSRSGD